MTNRDPMPNPHSAPSAVAALRDALMAARAYVETDRDELLASCTVQGDRSTLDPEDAEIIGEADDVLSRIDAALAAPAEYPDGLTERDHIAHDMRQGRFPGRSSVASFLRERALETTFAMRQRLHELSNRTEDDYDRGVLALLADFNRLFFAAPAAEAGDDNHDNELASPGVASIALKNADADGLKPGTAIPLTGEGSCGARRASDLEPGTGAGGSVRAAAFGHGAHFPGGAAVGVAGLATIREVIDLWFAPWGSWKTPAWEEMSGDRAFTADNALAIIRDRLAAAPDPAAWGAGDLAPDEIEDAVRTLHLVADQRYTTRHRAEALRKAAARLRGAAAGVVGEIAAERRRQIEAEGWTPEHDDAHVDGEMARAAACYAVICALKGGYCPPWLTGTVNRLWPWEATWWKPTDHRRNLIKAAALILAEIERVDRATAPAPVGEAAE